MKKKVVIYLILTTLLVSCFARDVKPPKNLDNACSLIKEKKSWYKHMKRTEDKWGVPIAVQMAVIYQESSFRANARTPYEWKFKFIPLGRQSSAFGFAQAIDSTWHWYKRDTGRIGAKRNRFRDSVDFIGWYMHQSYKKLGLRKSDAYRQYLAYHDGHMGYKRRIYRKKPWLMDIAKSVENRAKRYSLQLSRCT